MDRHTGEPALHLELCQVGWRNISFYLKTGDFLSYSGYLFTFTLKSWGACFYSTCFL